MGKLEPEAVIEAVDWGSQTDNQYAGWTFFMMVKDPTDPDWQRSYAEAWLKWLEQWNPPREWMQ